jgi:hypothetical protein
MSFPACVPMAMSLVWCCSAARAISRLGFASAPHPQEPALATAVSKQLARTYGGDLASTDGCHWGRLAGFTNQKLQRRTATGYAPWVKIVEAHAGIPLPHKSCCIRPRS